MAKSGEVGSVAVNGQKLEVYGVESAPIVMVDRAVSASVVHGLISVTVVTNNPLPNADAAGGIDHLQVTGILKMTAPGAVTLIDALQKMLLAVTPVQPTQGGTN